MNLYLPQLGDIREDIKAIKQFADVLSHIKGSLTPHQKNWEEFSLKVYAKGLTTTPIPVNVDGHLEAMDLNLNFVESKLKVFVGSIRDSIDLAGKTQSEFVKELQTKLNTAGVDFIIPQDKFNSTGKPEYNHKKIEDYWTVLRFVYFTIQEFRGKILNETSNINFWPHHFDLAMLWFSGRLVEGQDPENWDYSREQMNFGFSAGDEGIKEPYFYITAYPFPEDITNINLSGSTYWHTEGWNGAIYTYSDLLKSENSPIELLKFFEEVLSFVTNKMK